MYHVVSLLQLQTGMHLDNKGISDAIISHVIASSRRERGNLMELEQITS
jgi:hypothetical protein